ncbi:RNA-binding domain-containing protein [Umezawaea endophytica]|uniref:ATP-binding protein n=1 Tax=Umezawaea endophytica TaxID=1654476 RepID=A0A9X2VLQ2_9PSEU|nr:ATP-binding protein [Umezawaea endophytica]MCS7478744.1 ATP-binding protein [Umezawaea endophytica]
MATSGLERARQALLDGDLSALLGVRESIWLDVKRGVYPLDQPKGPEELAKDVAAFANTPDGGLILVGFSTRKEHGEEIVDALKLVPRKLINLDKYRQIIATRVIPALRQVSVDWIERETGMGVLVIDIPAQPEASQPFAVPAPTGTVEVSKTAVGFPIRTGDATVWLHPHDIQRYARMGWASSGAQAPQRNGEPKYIIGGGEPGWIGAFQHAQEVLAEEDVTLGNPVSDVSSVGPGVAQHFEAPGQSLGWVLGGQSNQRPVLVAEEIWQALLEQGSGSPDGEPLGALGFPAEDPTKTRPVDRNATVVALAGGRWGRGRLLRDTDQQGQHWRWEPDPVANTIMSAWTRNWTPRTVPLLRARVLAILPWADISDMKITPDRLDMVCQQLPLSHLASFTTTLSLRRGRELPAAVWEAGPHDTTKDGFSYSSEISAPDGRRALAAEVMMALPSATSSAVVTCAEVRIENFDVWSSALGVDPTSDLRWSVDDLFEFFLAAWETATELLPRLAAQDPATRHLWSDVPKVELLVSINERHNQPDPLSLPGPPLLLDDVLNLDSFGPSGRRGEPCELFVSLPSTSRLDPASRRSQARSALVEMAHHYGFMQVREDFFDK